MFSCFGRGELDSMISGWVRAPCLSPESFDVTHQVQQFQGQWMAITPKDVFIIYDIYIWEKGGFQYILDYTTLYPSWCPFIYLISPSLRALYPYTKWMAQSPDSRPCSKEVFAYKVQVWKWFGFAFQIEVSDQNHGKWLENCKGNCHQTWGFIIQAVSTYRFWMLFFVAAFFV